MPVLHRSAIRNLGGLHRRRRSVVGHAERRSRELRDSNRRYFIRTAPFARSSTRRYYAGADTLVVRNNRGRAKKHNKDQAHPFRLHIEWTHFPYSPLADFSLEARRLAESCASQDSVAVCGCKKAPAGISAGSEERTPIWQSASSHGGRDGPRVNHRPAPDQGQSSGLGTWSRVEIAGQAAETPQKRTACQSAAQFSALSVSP